MWEITIKSTQEHFYMLNYIEDMLNSHFGNKIVLGKYNFVETCLSVGTSKQNGEEVWEYLKRVLCDVFCQKFKEEFLLNSLGEFSSRKEYYPIFVRIFTYFDLELEHSIAYRLLNFSPCIVLESFFSFKLNVLKKKWEDVVSLWNNNQFSLFSNESFLNLLKFLIDDMQCKTETVVLSFEDGCLVYEKEQDDYVWKAIPENVIDVICLMIDLSPQTIIVHPSLLHKQAQEMICFLFGNRIK